MGDTNTVVAELLITWLRAVVNKNTPDISARGPKDPNELTKASARNSAPPVNCKAMLIGIMAAMRTTLLQLTDRYACSIERQPPKTITMAAINAAMTVGTNPVTINIIMEIRAMEAITA